MFLLFPHSLKYLCSVPSNFLVCQRLFRTVSRVGGRVGLVDKGRGSGDYVRFGV